MLILVEASVIQVLDTNLHCSYRCSNAVHVELQIIKVFVLMSTLITAGIKFHLHWRNAAFVQINTIQNGVGLWPLLRHKRHILIRGLAARRVRTGLKLFD